MLQIRWRLQILGPLDTSTETRRDQCHSHALSLNSGPYARTLCWMNLQTQPARWYACILSCSNPRYFFLYCAWNNLLFLWLRKWEGHIKFTKQFFILELFPWKLQNPCPNWAETLSRGWEKINTWTMYSDNHKSNDKLVMGHEILWWEEGPFYLEQNFLTLAAC